MDLEPILTSLVPRIESLGSLSYWIVFLVGFVESLPFIGILMPGSLVLIACGMLAAGGVLHPGEVILAAFTGSLVADCIGYYLGRHKGRKILHASGGWIIRREHLDKADAYFESHGGKSIFLGRFVGFVRPFAPVIGGMHHVPFGKFTALTAASGAIWTTAYVLIGFFFAEKSKMILGWINRASYVTLVILAVAAVTLVYILRKRKLLEDKKTDSEIIKITK